MMAIDTVMLSFCEDCEAHGGEPRKAPPLLLHALHTAAAAEEDRAAHRWGQPPMPPRHACRFCDLAHVYSWLQGDYTRGHAA